MEIHLYYNFGKLVYCFVSRRNRKFYFYEIAGIVITLLLIYLIQYVFFPDFLNPSSPFFEYKKIFLALFYSTLFFGTSIISRYMSESIPEETISIDEYIKEDKRKKKEKIKSIAKPRVSVGIIDFSWLFIMSLTYGGLSYVVTFESISGILPLGRSNDYYDLYYDEVKYLFQESINVAIILGTVLAGCMAILWGDAIWRKRDPNSIINYKGTTIAAMKMVIAFFIIILSELLWISLPLYVKMTSIKDLLV